VKESSESRLSFYEQFLLVLHLRFVLESFSMSPLLMRELLRRAKSNIAEEQMCGNKRDSRKRKKERES
jgi:hypothetical protein